MDKYAAISPPQRSMLSLVLSGSILGSGQRFHRLRCLPCDRAYKHFVHAWRKRAAFIASLSPAERDSETCCITSSSP